MARTKSSRRSKSMLAVVAALIASISGVGYAGCSKVGETGNTSPTIGLNLPGPRGDAGSIQVYFTRPEQAPEQPGDIASVVVGHIDETQRTLDVAAFELDNKAIVAALVRAAKRNVRVRVVTETDYLEESGILAVKAAGVPVVDDKRPGSLMHNKFMVFDNRSVWTGSMNFTENCAYKNNNHGVYIADAKLAENYATKFAWMFELQKFGGAPTKTAKIPHPDFDLADGTRVQNYFSTHDHCAAKVIEAVTGAKKSVHFLAFSFTHAELGRTMLDRAKSGVEVRGVFETSQASSQYCQFERLKAEGLAVFTDANPRNMHHKAIIIDGETVVCGSFNFSDSADKSNDENLLILHSPAVAKQFEQEFQKLFDAAKMKAAK